MRTRFAPSPTGPLHLGHAYAAILAHDMARAAGGAFLIRIEDIDRSRARPEWEAQNFDDLRWLALAWEEPVLRQSDNLAAYRAALARLTDAGLTYPCACRRRDIEAALTAPQEGDPPIGPDGPVYPGTCRHLGLGEAGNAIRLDMARAATGPVRFTDELRGEVTLSPEEMVAGIGDVILARRDMGTSYHLSVVVDDAAQGITHVTRGEDLFEATAIHALLQDRLGLPRPVYHHHRLIRDASGKRLAKRDDARAISRYREEGASPADVRRMVGLPG
ncbi:tRNA glutamyl-Q(34) synthetase GluQRS [Pseudoroseicyclus sp. CXY001]|uniref:tRNA glutamyl-Q(34) synthetase GluQRS n=1 Tax=Pseudoroseicyclus sp. CXY001 TaxID=3242492 RepID=UPI00358DAB9A